MTQHHISELLNLQRKFMTNHAFGLQVIT